MRNSNIRFINVIIIVVTLNYAYGYEIPYLSSFIHYLNDTIYNREFSQVSHLTPEELGPSVGQCSYDLLRRLTFLDMKTCEQHDFHILHLLPSSHSSETPRKPPVVVKCLQPEPTMANVTHYRNRLLIMESYNEIVELLKPIGQSKHRLVPGSCVLIFFYAPSCASCAQVAPYVNLLPALFPTLRIAAIDAYKYTTFNTEFGILGLPTLMLFHQGRPIVKFYSDMGTFAKFVTRHTGIRPVLPVPRKTDLTGPLPLKPVEERDYILWLSWAFVIICAVNYFTKTQLWQRIVEGIRHYWRVTEEQMEQTEDEPPLVGAAAAATGP